MDKSKNIEILNNKNDEKIKLLLYGTGDLNYIPDAVQMIQRNKNISFIKKYIKNKLKLEKSKNLNIYIADCYIPPVEERVGEIFDKFKNESDTLVIRYSTTNVFG